jgi:hypothetical protein
MRNAGCTQAEGACPRNIMSAQKCPMRMSRINDIADIFLARRWRVLLVTSTPCG